MKHRSLNDYFRDIWQASRSATGFVEGMTFDQFLLDERTKLAVQKAIENIGEAVRNIPVVERKKHPVLPWKKMVGMRNKLVHEYHGVNWQVVWDTATKDLPGIMPSIIGIVDSMDKELFDKLNKGEI